MRRISFHPVLEQSSGPNVVQRFLNSKFADAASDVVSVLLEPARHASALTRLAALALGAGAPELALTLADRRCRIAPPVTPLDLVLRAELLHRCGDHAAARADIQAALKLDPDHAVANRKQLMWATGPEQREAAACLVEREYGRQVLLGSLQVLASNGIQAVARGAADGGVVRGWAAWRQTPPPELVLEHQGKTTTFRLRPDAGHPLAAALGQACNFAIPSAAEHGHWFAATDTAGPLRLSRSFTMFTAPSEARPPGTLLRHSPQQAKPDVWVVVPVYRDLAATRDCLESLLASIAAGTLAAGVLVVDDASPEPGMADYLRSLPVDLITNPVNLGFVGAVNAALAAIGDGDVMLLNADTIVPPGAIDRLRDVAHSAENIGTVTPLSNNGELTSLPVPFRENALPSGDEIMRIDAIAAGLGGCIDIPSGIGFCLYVKRRCLDAAGGLSSRYERGYGEDVHLCLAAAEAGFRNVCATGVYVGHAGTRSFGTEKRRLVMRNLARLAARFPQHDQEVAAFVAADPLRPTRHAIGRSLIRGFSGPVIVAARGSLRQAEAQLSTHAAERRQALLVLCDRGEAVWRMFDADGGLAAETAFELPDQFAVMSAWRSTLRCDLIEVFSPAAFAALGFDAASSEFDLHIADAAAVMSRSADVRSNERAIWQILAANARRLVAPDEPAHAFARRAWPDAGNKLVQTGVTNRSAARARESQAARAARLGIVLLDETADCRRLVRAIAAVLPRAADAMPAVIVLGETADDLGLMRPGGVMVSGAVVPSQLAATAERYRVTHLMALSSGAHFGAPAATAVAALDLPLAQFAWSAPASTVAGDLWLAPSLDDAGVASALASWLTAGDGAA